MTDSHQHAALIIEGSSSYNSLQGFNNEVARVLRSTGLDVIFLDFDNPKNFSDRLKQALNDYPNHIDLALSFSGYGVEVGATSDNGNLWQRLRIPFLSWMLDHPCYYLSRHNTPVPAVLRMYPNHDFLDFHRNYVRSTYRTSFMRFGAMTHGRQPFRRELAKGEAPLIILPKSGNDPTKIEKSWKNLPLIMQQMIHDAIDHYWGETQRSGNVVNSVIAAADKAGVELRNDVTLLTFFVTQLDDYMRRRKADLLVRELLTLPVTIYGQGFEYMDVSHARARLLTPLNYTDLIDKYFEATAIISMNPNIDDECHDRPYAAFGSGALPISDINPWWATKFPSLLPYSYDFRSRSITAAIENVLTHPDTAARVAWESSQSCCAERTFDMMIHDVLNLAAMHRYFTFNFEPPQNYYTKCGD